MEIDSKELASFYGVTGQTIINWVRSGCPLESGGGRGKSYIFNSVNVHDWLVAREVERSRPKASKADYDKAEEDARLTHHKANNEELKERVAIGELLPTRLVIEMCSAGVTNCRNRLIVVDKKLRSEFPGLGDEVFERIEWLINDSLTQLGADGVPSGLEERIQGYLVEHQAAAETDLQPMG